MGVVGEYLLDLLAKQVDAKGVVVWFDPERHYTALAATLAIPDIRVTRYDDSFFALRHEVDSLLDGEEPPRLLVYVPLAEEATRDALIELTAMGTAVKPGQQPWQRNTKLAVVTRSALKETLSAEQLNTLEKQIEAGQLTSLAEVEIAVERIRRQVDPGVIVLIFGTSSAEEVALTFLGDSGRDEQVTAKGALRDLAALAGQTFGCDLAAAAPSQLRADLARHVLCTDLIATLHSPIPPQLATIRIATETAPRDACVRLARRWRQDRDLADAYAEHAQRVERELGLANVPLTLDQIRNCDTFATIEKAAETAVEEAWVDAPSPALLDVSDARRRGFWVTRMPQVQTRWALCTCAGKLLLRAAAIESALKAPGQSAAALAERYTTGDDPWCELDTFHRELEQRSRRFDFTAEHRSLDRLLAHARRRYMDMGDSLAEGFTHALVAGNFHLPKMPRQRAIYPRYVAPALKEGKTAYILADALRYEMARELVRGLGDDYDATLDAAIASVPTITEIGMASLLPAVADDAEIVPTNAGKIGLRIGGTVLRDRESRLAWLTAHATLAASGEVARVVATTFDGLMSLKPALKAKIAAADLVVVMSQEIDSAGEQDNISFTHAVMDELLAYLTRGIRRLAELGCQRIILAADHGYLFGDELDDAMKIDPPGGQELDLHRRVWVGRGGDANPAYLRARLGDFGLSAADLEIATPWGFGAFKTSGGARAYFHGGLSLPELIVPVVVLVARAGGDASAHGGGSGEIAWELALNSKRITTRFCSVQVGGHGSLFEAAIPRVRVEVRAGEKVISAPVAASYGLSDITGELQLAYDERQHDAHILAPASVTLMITPGDVPAQVVSLHLEDALTGRELRRLDGIELAISIG